MASLILARASYPLTLGMAARKSRAADNKTAIFSIFFDDDFQIHALFTGGFDLIGSGYLRVWDQIYAQI
jgi:hypothetical protein